MSAASPAAQWPRWTPTQAKCCGVTQSVQEPLRELGENAKGKQRWGPAGASVWNTPTVDAKRGLIYVGTGNSFGRIAAATSDSILALRMEDGKMMWHHQEFEGDAFMARCQATNPADSNCAEKLGPDYDFGGSSAILQTVNGKDILLAAGKGGVAIALDPDNEGKLLWRTQLWEDQAPSASGSSGLGRRGRWQPRVLSAAAARRRIEGAGHQNRQGGLECRHQRRPARAGGSGQCDPGGRLHGRMGWDPARRRTPMEK